jgi:hypothetical protein
MSDWLKEQAIERIDEELKKVGFFEVELEGGSRTNEDVNNTKSRTKQVQMYKGRGIGK